MPVSNNGDNVDDDDNDDDDDEEDDGDDEGDEDEDEECVVRLDKTGRPRIRGDGRGRLIQHQNVSHLLYWFL